LEGNCRNVIRRTTPEFAYRNWGRPSQYSNIPTFRQRAVTLTNCVEQSPSSEAVSHSDSQEIPRLLCNPEVHYHVHKSPPTRPYPEPAESSPHHISLRSNSILSSHERLCLSSGLFRSNCACLSHSPVTLSSAVCSATHPIQWSVLGRSSAWEHSQFQDHCTPACGLGVNISERFFVVAPIL
jgi:hypothetical protein